jgi:phage gp45-like
MWEQQWFSHSSAAGNQRIIVAAATAAHAAATAAHAAATAHARGQIMGNQRIIAAAAAAAAAAVVAAAVAVAVAPGRIKAHARGQMMTRVLLWGGMLPWINVRKGGNQRIKAHAAA